MKDFLKTAGLILTYLLRSVKLISSLKFTIGYSVIILYVFPAGSEAQVQVYPVSVTTQLSPPYSVNLADYAAPGSGQLKVIILQRDLTQAAYRLFLRMNIELNGRTIIRSSPLYVPPPFTLEPGIPAVFSGSDLSPFFDPQNMDFVGYSRESYMRSKLLPEGAYIITFTAYDWTRREVALSSGGSFFCYLAKADPPLLNLPVNNALLPASSPQFINFQWLSRTTSSPNSAYSTSYKFELFEMRVGGMSPAEVVQTSRPVFTATTDRTSLIYSIAEPALEKGMRYVWRVRATDVQGRDYIRNNGFSEVFSFIYGTESSGVAELGSVENFIAKAVTPRKAELTWDASSGYDSYKIFYRKKGDENRWYESETIQNTAELKGLTPGVLYECRVQGKKGIIWGNASDIDTVAMPLMPVIECGSPFNPLDVANNEPLGELMRLQQFDAGGFMVTLTDPYAISTKPGVFSGKGFVEVPLLGYKKIRCEFRDIFLNTDFQMVRGQIQLITDNSQDGDNALWSIDDVFEGGTNNGVVRSGTEEAALVIPDVVITNADNIILDTASHEILLVNESSDTVHFDVSEKLAGKPGTLTVEDSEGNLYSVSTSTGKATSLGKAPAAGAQQIATLPSSVDERKGIVYFDSVPGKTRFAFDKRDAKYAKSNLFNEEYRTIKMNDGSLYDVPFKLIPVGETDIVSAKVQLKSKNISPDSVVFRSGTGTVYKAVKTGTGKTDRETEYQITLPSGKDNDGIEIFATWTDSKRQTFVLGKMIAVSYSVKRPKLTLVPVNDNGEDIDPELIKKELDKVYLPVAVDWQVTLDRSNFSARADSLKITESGLFSKYTNGMKQLNTDFILHKREDFDPSTIYLFMLQFSGDVSATGDMPRGNQFGYIFTRTAGVDKAIYRTIAHEIAHGTFSLKHTFDGQYQIDQGTTSNLLDYTAGTELVKHQWDAIHDPGLVIGLFERDEDAMLLANTYYWTPAGTPFFSKSTCTTILDINKITNSEHINGVLYSFEEKGITYEAQIDTAKNLFYGYVRKGTAEKYIDNTSLAKGNIIRVNSIFYSGNCTKEDVITQYTVIEDIKGGTYYLNGKDLIASFNYTNGIKANVVTIKNCSGVSFTGKAKAFKEYCTGKFDIIYTLEVDKVASQIQLMAEKYDDYEKLILSTNPYSTWVNTPEKLKTFNSALASYYESHQKALKIESGNCPECPKYPIVGDSYWDESGRNWVFWDDGKWKDLSGEFCDEAGCNNEWKNGIDIQAVHKAYYTEKLRILENDIWQRSLGINDEFKKNLWKATQFATVKFLKEKWVAENVNDNWLEILTGNIQTAINKIKVANGDQTYYVNATLNGLFGAFDVLLLESIAKNLIWKVGIKYLIIEGGAKQLSKQIYYTVSKKALTYQLAYKLSFGTPEATAFFEKQLTKTINIYDQATGRYIKFDPVTGETLAGKFASDAENSIVYEGYGKIPGISGLSESQQANYVTERIETIITENLAKAASAAKFDKLTISSINGFSDNVGVLVAREGLNLEKFKILQTKTAASLTEDELVTVSNVRNQISQPDENTIIQKVIPKKDINNYINIENPKIGGYVTTAKDAKHLKTYDDIYFGLRLDYKLGDGVSQNFYLSDGSCGVIRYKTTNAKALEIPRYPKINDPPPFTGHGFTAANNDRLAVPEWKSEYITPDDGAELWEVFSDGTEELRAVYSSRQNKFLLVK